MKSIVTGANGLLGAHVLLALSRRQHVITATHRSGADLQSIQQFFEDQDPQAAQYFSKIKWLELDILDLPTMEEVFAGADQVFHCAGLVSFERKDRAQMLKVNGQGTANVVQVCLSLGLRLCHVSSVAAIHNLDYKKTLDETVFWKKSGKESDYAISKYNAEREVWRGIEEGLKAVIVNPAVILSGGMWGRSSNRMMATVDAGNPFYTSGVAGYVAAPDVAEIMAELMAKKIEGERFILNSGTYSFRDIFGWMAQSLGKKAPSWAINRTFLSLAALADRLRCVVFRTAAKVTPELVNAAFNQQSYSGEKVKNALNFEYRSVPDFIKEAGQRYQADQRSKKNKKDSSAKKHPLSTKFCIL
jgi:nucleoside-diphosphate-sugar epimerase